VIFLFNFSLLHFRCQKYERDIENSKLSPVSILKPLKGADANLHINLETFFTMSNYPQFELLFCVVDHDDESIEIVMSKYPEVDAQLVYSGGYKVGINPKVNNMISGYERSKYDLIMISDDKMCIQPDALCDMVAQMKSDDEIGMVVQIPYYKSRSGFSAFFESILMMTLFKFYIVSRIFGTFVVPGMSSLIKKEILERAGGLQHFGKYLAEDFKMIKFTERNGWKVQNSRYFGLQNQSKSGVLSIYERVGRWERVAKFSKMFSFYIAILIMLVRYYLTFY